ncbi:MAG: hypothetical protein GX382_08730 [Syntrophomonadaceae bacterium]|jgi:hypothetical protein|nr:hypothetical protein [Syntrophomonadaceae bacterium]
MKRLGIIAVLGFLAISTYADDIGVITNYCVSLQFKDGSMGGVAIPWILDRRNPDYFVKAVTGLQVGDADDIWFISTDTMPIVATNGNGQTYTLPRK